MASRNRPRFRRSKHSHQPPEPPKSVQLRCIGDDGEVEDKTVLLTMTRDHDGSMMNRDLLVIKSTSTIDCVVPENIVDQMRSIESVAKKMLGGDNEFGGYLKGKFRDGKLYIEACPIDIPPQKVTTVTITFQRPNDETAGYNGVIHRHPDGVRNFSGVDDQSINRNFTFSLLYVNSHITTGIINFTQKDAEGKTFLLQFTLNIRYLTTLKVTHTEDDLRPLIQAQQTSIGPSLDSRGVEDAEMREYFLQGQSQFPPAKWAGPLLHRQRDVELDKMLRELNGDLQDDVFTTADNAEATGTCPYCQVALYLSDPTKFPTECNHCASPLEPEECNFRDNQGVKLT